MEKTVKKPNVIYIMADDLGYGDLGCYGAEKIPTPHIDKIASEGMMFSDAHSSSAVCSPSRYSVVTGRFCWRSWLKKWVLWGHSSPLIEKERMTIGDIFKKNGYTTAVIGKWHLGLGWQYKKGKVENWRDPPYDAVDYSKKITHSPNDLGFDYFFGIAGSLDMFPYCYIENNRTVGIPNKLKEVYYQQQRKGYATEDWKDEEVDIKFTQKACEFIEKSYNEDPNRPFFVYLPTSCPHRPCDVQPDFIKGKSDAGDRGDMVVLFDWIVGQVDNKIKELGLTDNTLIMISSDNGARLTCYNGKDYAHKSCGELRGQKADIWDGGHREPFLARWPGMIKAGSRSDQLICLSDLFATFAELFREPLPEVAAEDSISFLSEFNKDLVQNVEKGEKGEKKRKAIVHHSGNGMFSIRKGYWKLIDGRGSGGFTKFRSLGIKYLIKKALHLLPPGQLYNLKDDLQERHNLWKKHPEKVKELLALLDKAQNEEKTRDMFVDIKEIIVNSKKKQKNITRCW